MKTAHDMERPSYSRARVQFLRAVPAIGIGDVLEPGHPLYAHVVWWQDEHGLLGASYQGRLWHVGEVDTYLHGNPEAGTRDYAVQRMHLEL